MLLARPSGPSVPTAAALPEGQPLLVFAEFGPTADRIYLAPAEAPGERILVETVEHAQGWGIMPAAGVMGGLIAYTVLPSSARPDRDSPAELWVLDLESRDRTRLARDADLLIAPIFVDGGSALLYRRSGGQQQEIVRVEIATLTRRAVHAEQTAFGIFPVGYDHEGSLVFARLSTAGTDILNVREGRAPAFLFHASGHIAHGWQLSPDGRAISFLAPEPGAERVVMRAYVVDLATAQPQGLAPDWHPMAQQFSPVWTPDGRALAVGQEPGGLAAGHATVLGLDGQVGTLAAPAQGFDVPVAWSANGRYLAVRTFDGFSAQHPGVESATVVGVDGRRWEVTAPTEITVIGWHVRA
jgi:hypothetical protein